MPWIWCCVSAVNPIGASDGLLALVAVKEVEWLATYWETFQELTDLTPTHRSRGLGVYALQRTASSSSSSSSFFFFFCYRCSAEKRSGRRNVQPKKALRSSKRKMP